MEHLELGTTVATAAPEFPTFFCPSRKLSKNRFLSKWKSLNMNDYYVDLGQVFTRDVAMLVSRMQAHRIMGTIARCVEERTLLYFSGLTSDNVAILIEVIVDRCDKRRTLCHYKTESEGRDGRLEALLKQILSVDGGEASTVIGR